MVDEDQLTVLILLFVLTSLFISIGLSIGDSIMFKPHRAEEAQQECIERGFDNYQSYSGFLRKEAYGVKCEYITEREDKWKIK